MSALTVLVELIVLLPLLALLGLFVYTLFNGAVSVPTKRSAARKMVELAGLKPEEKAVDLGSGGGRLMFALAESQPGAEVHGYEINPVLVLWTKWEIRRRGLRGRVHAHWRGLMRCDTGGFDVVTVYLIPKLMARLEGKLRHELRPGARVISNFFAFPTWEPETERGTVRRYIR